MRIYIAGPMRGIRGGNAESFREARDKLRDMKYDVFCPSEFTQTLKEQKKSTALRNVLAADVSWICRYAEAIVVLPGWAVSKGALAEVHLAWAIGIPVYEYELFARRVIKEVRGVPGIGS